MLSQCMFSMRPSHALRTHRYERRDVMALNRDLENVIIQRKSRLRRFFAARRHSEELRDIVSQLEAARMNYMVGCQVVFLGLAMLTHFITSLDGNSHTEHDDDCRRSWTCEGYIARAQRSRRACTWDASRGCCHIPIPIDSHQGSLTG